MSRFKQKKSKEKEAAERHITQLFEQADAVFKKNKSLASRYVKLARKISSRLKVRIPLQLKRRFCKNCNNYLKPGVNATIRLNKGKKTYFCKDCKNIVRVPYRR